jgi:hypothetical protein
MIFHCPQIHLSKCSGLWVSLRGTKYEFKLSTARYVGILVYRKSDPIISWSSAEDYQHTTFDSPALTGARFASTL